MAINVQRATNGALGRAPLRTEDPLSLLNHVSPNAVLRQRLGQDPHQPTACISHKHRVRRAGGTINVVVVPTSVA